MTARPRFPDRLAFATAFVLLLAVGCGDPSGRQKVSGQVTLKGQPVDQGSLEFIPTAADGVSHAGAVIENGHYTIPANKGLVPGNYAIKIYWPERIIKTEEAPGPLGPGPKDRMPFKYNTKTTLTREVKQGDNTFDFHLD